MKATLADEWLSNEACGLQNVYGSLQHACGGEFGFGRGNIIVAVDGGIPSH